MRKTLLVRGSPDVEWCPKLKKEELIRTAPPTFSEVLGLPTPVLFCLGVGVGNPYDFPNFSALARI